MQVCQKVIDEQEVSGLSYLLTLLMEVTSPLVCVSKWKFSETFSVLNRSLISLALACLRMKADVTCHWKTL